MTEKIKSNVGEKKSEVNELPLGLIFVAIVFFIRGLYMYFVSIQEFEIIPGGLFGKLLAVLGILIAIFYFISFAGLLKRKRFSIYMASFLIIVDVFFSLAMMGHLIILGIGALFGIILLYLMWLNEGYLNKFDRADKGILTVSVLIGLLYVCSLWYASTLPSEEEIYDRVTNDALEKKDPMVCKKLSKEGLVFNCIKKLNWELKDPKLCEMIKEGYRDKCYDDLARALNNETYCYNISSPYTQKLCLNWANYE